MNWQWATLNDILHLNTTLVTILDAVLYKQVALQPFPRGIVLKTVKRGLDFPQKRQNLLRSGQFVVSRFRVHKRIWGMVPPELDRAVVTRNHLIFDLDPELHPDYFAAYLSTSAFRQAVLAACSGHGRLVMQQFEKIAMPLPSVEDQRQIAELWRYAHTALEHTTEMLTSIAAIKEGVAGDLFRNMNPVWEQTTLGECAAIGRGVSGSYSLSIIPPDQLVLGAIFFDERSIGILPNVDLDSKFLYYYLKSQKQELYSAQSGTKAGLEDILRLFPLPLPTLYEQRKIAAALRQHDETLLCIRSEQDTLRKLTHGILQSIFSGTLNLQEVMPMLRSNLV